MNVQLHYKEDLSDTQTTKKVASKSKICDICEAEGRYKCPTCLVYYCSVTCCKLHRAKQCEISMEKPLTDPETPTVVKKLEYLTESTVPEERLQLLRNNKMLNDLLCNSHLRNLLKTVDEAPNPEEMMQKAMQEPLFVEFADACLRIIDPDNNSRGTFMERLTAT